MNEAGPATRLRLRDLRSPPMRAFHLSWIAFFVSFFGWFGVAPLLAVVRDDLRLGRDELARSMVASVAITVVARVAMGRLCDRIGPRLAYAALLVAGAVPVMAIGLARDAGEFVLWRLAIGAVGASFVVTQHHTSLMFAPGCVGTANATAAGWGNLGAGAAQIAMPAALAGLAALGVAPELGWRAAMLIPGIAMLATGFAYLRFTQDTPAGNFAELRAVEPPPARRPPATEGEGLLAAARDPRVWALFVLYGACFGLELTLNNFAALYFHDRFGLGLGAAGLVAGGFGLLNLFARTLGGLASDLAARRAGLRGRATLLGAIVLAEGASLTLFARASELALAIAALLVLGVAVKMASGATFGVVPFVRPRALGSVAGLVGAGGNAGAVASGLLLGGAGDAESALLALAAAVAACSLLAALLRGRPAAAGARAAAEATGFALRAQPASERALAAPTAASLARRRPAVVALVGAGPGDPGLLTLRALERLREAEVVLHDRLVSPEIVALGPPGARYAAVGGRCGRDAGSQAACMATMIDLARAGLRVVRLKSGDPFVFGRGGEEAEALARAGVPFEIVPGITAANGCAAGIGVPLTHRDLAHSVRLVTGRLRAGAPEPDWRALAAGAETLVVYMGLRSLGPLCASLRAAGVRGDLPLALVQNGTRAEQRVALGKLDEAEALARGVDPSAGPTLLILGDVVALAKVGKSWRSAA